MAKAYVARGDFRAIDFFVLTIDGHKPHVKLVLFHTIDAPFIAV
jgi:hypothetical protein